jgi:hypothetical protein
VLKVSHTHSGRDNTESCSQQSENIILRHVQFIASLQIKFFILHSSLPHIINMYVIIVFLPGE